MLGVERNLLSALFILVCGQESTVRGVNQHPMKEMRSNPKEHQHNESACRVFQSTGSPICVIAAWPKAVAGRFESVGFLEHQR